MGPLACQFPWSEIKIKTNKDLFHSIYSSIVSMIGINKDMIDKDGNKNGMLSIILITIWQSMFISQTFLKQQLS